MQEFAFSIKNNLINSLELSQKITMILNIAMWDYNNFSYKALLPNTFLNNVLSDTDL